MKKTLLFLLFISFNMVGFSQLSYSPEDITVIGNVNEHDILVDVDVTNDSSENVTFFWAIERTNAYDAWRFQICDQNTCYIWGLETCPPSQPNVLTPGSTLTFMIHMDPSNINGEGEVNFNIPDENGNVLLSIPIAYNVMMPSNTSDLEETNIKVYPNPTADQFFLDTNKDFSQVIVHNIIGKEIKRFNFNQGVNYQVDDLKKGIYLVSLVEENGNISKVLRLSKE